MHERTVLYKSITKFAFGFLIILININLSGFDILPDFAGYILFISAISELSDKYKKIHLLKPLAIILLIWSVASKILSYVNFSEAVPIINLVQLTVSIVQIYFSFQLLSEISLMVREYCEEEKPAKRLIILRNIYTVMNTLMVSIVNIPVITALNENQVILWIAATLTVFTVAVAIIIAVTLFSVRKFFREEEYSPEITEAESE